MLRVILPLLAFIFLGFLVGCSTDDKKSSTPEGAFEIAADFDKNERYEEAIRRYQEVKNKFPYSKYATMAELAVADVYYKQESFPEAQVSYQGFKDLHPKHPRIDYVVYKLGMSYFMQLPETIDRDLSIAANVISTFDDLMRDYPSSEHVKEAKEKREKAQHMLAEKEQYIAEFYFKREKFDSALGRFEGLLAKFPNLGFDAVALSKAAVAAYKIGEQDKARKYLFELERRFPGSDEVAFAKKEIR